ncbi:MAG: hypothetical protein ACRD29_03985 [Acidimicrobiales bacterium]
MNADTKAIHHPSGRRSRLGRAGPVAAVLVALGLLVAACGDDDTGPGVAEVDSTTTTTSSGSGGSGSNQASTPDPVAYARCMRDNGVPGFPDPNSDGTFEIDANELGVPPDSPQFGAADEACAHLLPQQSDEQQAEEYQARLRYAQCMRDEGIADFPDPPVPTEGPSTDSNSGGQQDDVGVDLDSPQFQAAHEACKDLQLAGDEGPTVNQDSGG